MTTRIPQSFRHATCESDVFDPAYSSAEKLSALSAEPTVELLAGDTKVGKSSVGCKHFPVAFCYVVMLDKRS